MGSYGGGRIRRIKIQNFMTYDNLEIHPKKGLNLILGLNGTGKSSIMCAICLGLAGKPQFTGRATQLSDFIKHGHQEAEIEIELETRKSSLLIRRKIKGDKCEWYLNRSLSNQNEVSSEVKKYNIDTSNLCQFLPQEKVAEFSRMDKKQRLENMLQAIGEPHLFELFNELKVLYKQLSDKVLNVKKIKISKNSAEEDNERISDEVNKQESRNRLKFSLDSLQKQKKVLVYQEIHNEFQSLRKKKEDLKKNLQVLEKERKEAISLEESISQSYANSSKKMEHLKLQKKKLIKLLTDLSNRLTNFNEEVEKAKIYYEKRLAEKEEDKKRSYNRNKMLEGYEKQYKEENKKLENFNEKELLSAFAHLQQEVSELNHSIEQANAEKNRVGHVFSQLRNKLNSLQDEHNKKLTNLQKRDRYTYQAACWLLENKRRFKSNVYLPIMYEINLHSPEYTKYVENSVGFQDMIAFVCEDKNDCERLTDILRNEQKIPVNIVMAPDTSMANFVSPPLSAAYRQCGLECFVKDLFTAPEPVMKYLCAICNIHRIPVAKSAIPPRSKDFILQHYSTFFSENTKVTGKRSKYGDRNFSSRTDFITSRNLLVHHNEELQNEVRQQLQRAENDLEIKQRELEKLKGDLTEKEKCHDKVRQELKSFQELKKYVQNIKNMYQQRKQFSNQTSVVIDEEEEKRKITKQIQSINENRDRVLSDLNGVFQDFIALEKEIIKVILGMNSLSKTLKLTVASNEDIHEKVNTAEKELGDVLKKSQEIKHTGTIMLAEIKAMGGNDDSLQKADFLDEVALPQEVVEKITLPMEEIEKQINHIQAQLNLNEDNEPVVVEYNARKQTIETLQDKINECQRNVNELKEIIEEKRKQWLEPLQRHLDNINKKFSRYFKQLSCAGEISLEIPENPDDFTKYGLQIKLKFREEEPLTELSPTHHSGGECSVAAIVFILSLQELTEVPFRCIDEINQGMDSVNERKIYQLIADSVGEDRCSQYFLLTPKLLEGMEYPKDIAVHIIFNSYFLNIDLDVKKHLKIAPKVLH